MEYYSLLSIAAIGGIFLFAILLSVLTSNIFKVNASIWFGITSTLSIIGIGMQLIDSFFMGNEIEDSFFITFGIVTGIIALAILDHDNPKLFKNNKKK